MIGLGRITRQERGLNSRIESNLEKCAKTPIAPTRDTTAIIITAGLDVILKLFAVDPNFRTSVQVERAGGKKEGAPGRQILTPDTRLMPI